MRCESTHASQYVQGPLLRPCMSTIFEKTVKFNQAHKRDGLNVQSSTMTIETEFCAQSEPTVESIAGLKLTEHDVCVLQVAAHWMRGVCGQIMFLLAGARTEFMSGIWTPQWM